MNLVLDTTAYRANNQNGLFFAGLSRLCSQNLLQLKIPFVVEQETLSQRKEEAVKLFGEARKSLDCLAKSACLTAEETGLIRDLESRLSDLKAPVASTRIVETWNSWKEMANAETLGLTSEQSENAIIDYINGTGPVSPAKNRKDLPDSFIFQQIRALAKDGGATVVVTGDKRLGEALSSLDNLTVFEELSHFLDSDPAKKLFLILTDQDMESDPSLVFSFLRDNSRELESCVKNLGGDKIFGVELPFDNPSENPSEHTIVGIGDLGDVIFDFENLQYYGAGEFGLEFEFSCKVTIDFFIDKSEYWMLDKEDQPSVSDWNEYVYHAESEEKIRASGVLKISAPLEIYRELLDGGDDFDISSFDVQIDSIENVEITS